MAISWAFYTSAALERIQSFQQMMIFMLKLSNFGFLAKKLLLLLFFDIKTETICFGDRVIKTHFLRHKSNFAKVKMCIISRFLGKFEA